MKIIVTLDLSDQDMERLKLDKDHVTALFRMTLQGIMSNLENAWKTSKVEARAVVSFEDSETILKPKFWCGKLTDEQRVKLPDIPGFEVIEADGEFLTCRSLETGKRYFLSDHGIEDEVPTE